MFNSKRLLPIIAFSLIVSLAPLNAAQAGYSISFNNAGLGRHHNQRGFPYQRPHGHYNNRFGKRSSHNSPFYNTRHGKRFFRQNSRHRQFRTCQEVIVKSRYGRAHVVERNCYYTPYKRQYKRIFGQHR